MQPPRQGNQGHGIRRNQGQNAGQNARRQQQPQDIGGMIGTRTDQDTSASTHASMMRRGRDNNNTVNIAVHDEEDQLNNVDYSSDGEQLENYSDEDNNHNGRDA